MRLELRHASINGGTTRSEDRKAGERIETTIGRITSGQGAADDYPYLNYEMKQEGNQPPGGGRATATSCPTCRPSWMGLKDAGFHATRAGVIGVGVRRYRAAEQAGDPAARLTRRSPPSTRTTRWAS